VIGTWRPAQPSASYPGFSHP